LPDNFIELKKGGLSFDGSTITPITLPLLAQEYGTDWKSTASGTPKYYRIDGGAIEFTPKPSTSDLTILLEYWAYANDLALTTDKPFTTGDDTAGYTYNDRLRSLDPLLVEYALGKAKYSLGFYDTTQQALSNFYALLDKKILRLRQSEDLEYNRTGIDPMHLRNIQRRLNG